MIWACMFHNFKPWFLKIYPIAPSTIYYILESTSILFRCSIPVGLDTPKKMHFGMLENWWYESVCPGISETRFGSSRPRPRLKRSESQWRDRDRDWKGLSLNDETETETEKVWVSMTRPRPRLKGSESQSRDRDRDHKNIETKTKVVETIKDETSKFGSRLISEYWSKPRLIETEKFYGCWDWDFTESLADLWEHTCWNGFYFA